MLGSDADVAGLYAAMGESVTFDLTPTDLTITAIFQGGTSGVSTAMGDIEAVSPSLICRTAQLTTAIVRGVNVTVRGDSYKIEKLHDHGTGETTLYLKTN